MQSPSSRAAMGIVKLAELIKEEAPDALRPASLQEYRGEHRPPRSLSMHRAQRVPVRPRSPSMQRKPT